VVSSLFSGLLSQVLKSNNPKKSNPPRHVSSFESMALKVPFCNNKALEASREEQVRHEKKLGVPYFPLNPGWLRFRDPYNGVL